MEAMPLLTYVTTALVVSYVYLAARWQYVKRPLLYLIGAGGIILSLIGLFFTLGSSSGAMKAMIVFQIIGAIAAFKGAVGACYGGKLPIWDSMFPPKGSEGGQGPSA